MKLFTLLKNLWKSARNYSDANLQTAKDYSDARGDYIVEQGNPTSYWSYRKWASGIAEAWCTNYNMGTRATTGTYGNGYYASIGNYTFPTGLFIDTPTVQLQTYCTNGLLNCSVYYLTSSVFSFYLYNTNKETTNTVYLNVYARGLWKAFENVGGVILNLLNNRRVVFA